MLEFSFAVASFVAWLVGLSTGAKWAYGAAFVVLSGVMGETVADLTNWFEGRDRAKGIVEKASALVLILGLAGDLVAIHMDQAEIARLTIEAGNAKDSAGRASDASSRAQQSASYARQRAGQVANEADALSVRIKREATIFEEEKEKHEPRRVT